MLAIRAWNFDTGINIATCVIATVEAEVCRFSVGVVYVVCLCIVFSKAALQNVVPWNPWNPLWIRHWGWNTQKTVKQDGNDTRILSHQLYILCNFANYALCLL